MRGMKIMTALALALGLAAGSPLAASNGAAAPPETGAAILLQDFGIYCQPKVDSREAAPGTELGYVNIFRDTPEIRFHQQQVPAAIGISFGVVFTPLRDIPGARMASWKPGATQPDVWFSDYSAGVSSSRGFTFEFASELVLGLWRLEAWQEDELLYAVEFDVVRDAALPDVLHSCAPALS